MFSILWLERDCVAKFGKMIELGKRDFMTHGTLSMSQFGGNRGFYGIDLQEVLLDNPEYAQRYVVL